jgi:hypothetical protein
MITADKLKTLTELGPKGLQTLLGKAGKDYALTGAKFLGLTNGGEFCYHVVHAVKGGTDSAKVFLAYDHTEDRVTATIG